MSAVGIIYWTMDGRFRRATGRVLRELPSYLVNGAQKQAHRLGEDPIINESPPIRLNSWSELAGDPAGNIEPVKPPQPLARAKKAIIYCEDNSEYPVSGWPWTNTETREEDAASTYQEAYNLAMSQVSRESNQSLLSRWGFLTMLGFCGVLVILIVAIAVQAAFGSPTPEGAAAVLSW